MDQTNTPKTYYKTTTSCQVDFSTRFDPADEEHRFGEGLSLRSEIVICFKVYQKEQRLNYETIGLSTYGQIRVKWASHDAQLRTTLLLEAAPCPTCPASSIVFTFACFVLCFVWFAPSSLGYPRWKERQETVGLNNSRTCVSTSNFSATLWNTS